MPDQKSLQLAPGVSREYLLHNRVCPAGWTAEGDMQIAVGQRPDPSALDDLAFAYRCKVLATPVTDSELEQLIERLATTSDDSLHIGTSSDSADTQLSDIRDLA